MKAIVRARKIFLNGKEVKTVVETVCAKCGTVINECDTIRCPMCKAKIEMK